MTLVARVACSDYGRAAEAFARSVELLGGAACFAARGEPLLIKPNLLAPHPPEAAVTTHPSVVDAALALAKDFGALPVVADSPGLGSVERAARVSGVLDACRRHGVSLLDLGASEPARASGTTYKALEIAREALEARWVWNLPKWKTHTMMGLTLGVKNLFGCVPGKQKIAWHFRAGRDGDAFGRHLLDLWEVLRPCLTVLDGIEAMEGPGPSRGRPIRRGLLLASADAPSLDWDAARLSGFEPADVPTVRLSLSRGLVEPDAVEIVGDPADPVRFAPAPGSPCDWPLPRFLKAALRGALAPLPSFDPSRCTGCGICAEACPGGALGPGTPPELSRRACIRCYCCQELCPAGAALVPRRRLWGGASHRMGRRA